MGIVSTRCFVVLVAASSGWCALASAGPAPSVHADAALQRPLFSPTRRPPPVAAAVNLGAPPPPAPVPPPNIALSGIIMGGGGGIALLRRPRDAAPIRVALGGQVEGWTVEEIRPRAIVLRRDVRSVTVDLAGP